jgi:L-ribulokinase
MGSDFEAEYFPQANQVKIYADFMKEYKALGEFIEQSIKIKII